MKLPRFTAGTPPPRSSGLARATDIGALTQTGEAAKWQGIGAIGGAMQRGADLSFRATLNRQALDDNIEMGNATQRTLGNVRQAADAAERLNVSMDMPLPDDPKYLETLTVFSTEKRNQLVKEALKDIEKNANKISKGFTRPENKAKFEEWYTNAYGIFEYKLKSMYAGKLDDYQRGELKKLSEDAAKNGDIETANRFVELMDEYELITHEKAGVLKKNNKVITDTSITTQMAQAIMIQTGYQDAIEFVAAQDIDVAVRDKVLSDLATQERIRSARHKQLQEETNRQMLADYWDGNLNDTQIVTDALRLGYLNDTDAKYLRNAIMNPKPPKLNLKSLAIVKQVIEEIGTNTKTKQQALSVLYSQLDSIDPTTGKSLVNDIYAEQDKNKSEIKRESRNLMEELVRDRDKFTGMFTDDERQILASAEAYLMLDAEIQKAIEIGKPLERRDIMIKAIQIGRQMKKKIKAEKEAKIEPSFGFRIELEGEGELTLVELSPIFEKATVSRADIYEGIGKLKQIIWGRLSRSEKLKAVKDLAGGIKAESIINQHKSNKSPYTEYPDAFFENGKWKVIRDGKKYRIEE